MKNVDLFSSNKYFFLIIDEGHSIKNPKSKLATTVKKLQSQHRLLLTGTPI